MVDVPFFLIYFSFIVIFIFALFIFCISSHKICTYILCVTVCSVYMDELYIYIFCLCLILWETISSSLDTSKSKYKTFIIMQAGKTLTHICTAYHPMPHTQKTQGTRSSFSFSLFFWPCYPSASLRSTSSMPQRSLGVSTRTSSGCRRARRFVVELHKPEWLIQRVVS